MTAHAASIRNTADKPQDGPSRKIWLDGKYYEKDEAVVSVFDHGLLYGDGVFEGIRAYNGNVFRGAAHIARLYASLAKVMANAEIHQKLLAVGIEPGISKSPEEFGAFIKSQAEVREKVIKAVGMKIE